MLRRKLLLTLGPIVALLLLTAVVAIWQLQVVLRNLNHIDVQAWQTVDQVNALSINLNAIEVNLYELQLGKQRHLDELIEMVDETRGLVANLDAPDVMHEPGCEAAVGKIRADFPKFERLVTSLATVQDPELARQYSDSALSTAVSLRQNTLPLSRYVRDHAHMEQETLLSSFRWLVLGLALVFVLVINVSVIVLLRLGTLFLQPVDKLLEATRRLGAEHYDYRVKIDQADEFAVLAEAYNSLAEQLQSNERKRIETLAQVAVTMNHELNNAIAIIDLQLAMLARQAGGRPVLEKYLRQIHDSLQHVTQTVQSLKSVRRIVLTDYAPGTKMLDLRRSVEEAAVDVQVHTQVLPVPDAQHAASGAHGS